MKRFSIIVSALILSLALAACEPADTTPEECQDGFVLVDDECVEEVIPDTVDPTFANVADINYTIGDDAPDYLAGITATDDVDGDLTSSITVDSSAVDLTIAGTYAVTLNVSDAAGNEATATYNVVVSERVLTNEELLALDLAAISLPSNVDEVGAITMPSFGSNGTLFFWSSSHPLIINIQGFVITPTVGSDPVDVTLTVRAVNGSYSENADFVVSVQPDEEVEVTSMVTVPFETVSEEWTLTDDPDVELFFVDNGNVPYIDVETFLNLLDGVIDSTLVSYTPIGDDQLELSYSSEWEDYDGTMINETLTVLIDFSENTMLFDDLAFMYAYGIETETDFGEGLNYIDADYTEGDPVLFELGNYNFDLVIHDDGTELEYLIPFHIANHLFASQNYFNVYYNGDQLWGIDTLTILSEDDNPEVVQNIRSSSFNAEDTPEDVKISTYYFTAFVLDYFFGIKYELDVETYYPNLAARVRSMINATDNTYYRLMHTIVYGLNDPHTYWGTVGYYWNDPVNNIGTSFSDLGERNQNLSNKYWEVFDANEAKFGVGQIPDYHIIDDGKTAVIFLTGFSVDTPPWFKNILDELPATVENVVVDVTMNGGGNSGAVSRTLGYMTEETIKKHYIDYLDGSTTTYYITSDYVAYDYNWFVLSSGYSYSAANIFVANAQEAGIPIIGQKSGGGASGVYSVQTPDGTVFFIASTGMSALRLGNEVDGYEYQSIEFGVEVDYPLVNLTNDDQLIAIINAYLAEQAE